MKKTRLLSMFIAVMMVLLITSSAMAETIVIGGAGPLTGGAAQYGISVEQGAQLYIDQINAELAASGSDTRFELIFEDNGGDDTEAQNVYYRLTESKGAVAFLGDVLSSNCKVVAECANEDGIPMVTASSTSYEITTDHPTVFRTCFLDPFQGVVMANYAKSKGYTKVAILYGNDDDYSIGLADSFEEQCKKNGMEVTAKESGSFSDMDFSAQLTKIASTNPEVVFLPFYGEQASMILSRAASIGMDVTFLGGDGISNIVDFMTDRKLLTKVVYCDHFDANSETEIVKKFKADFKAKYGTDVTLSFSATAYDAALVICQAILRAGSTDKAAIVEQIKTGTFDGVTSTITFDDHNDPIKSAFIMTFDESGNKTFIELLGNE